jgi:putative flippase GtrA
MWQARRLAGWLVVGFGGSIVELGLLKVLYEGIGWPLPIATAIAAEMLILAKFLVSDRFVFGYPRPGVRRLLRYHGASAGALLVYWLVINALVDLVAVPYPVGFVVGTGGAFVWSLITNFLWVWRRDNGAHAQAWR